MHEQAPDIDQFIAELSEIPASDPLVHVDQTQRDFIPVPMPEGERIVLPLNAALNAVLKTATQHKREADLDSLCFVSEQIEWHYKGKTVQSPLVLTPVSWKINKLKQEVELTLLTENAFVNPFVDQQLLRNNGLTIAENDDQSFADWLYGLRLFLRANQVPVTFGPLSGLGNFHHHRYEVLRELELIRQAESRSALVETILGREAQANEKQQSLSPGLLVPADADQWNVFAQSARENTVIQGPPGTGKSQVLTNLLGKCLVREGLTLVVSEKRVALDVLVKKLQEIGLADFTFTAHSQAKPRDFIQRLKTTWQLLEQEPAPVPAMLQLSDQLKDQLQLTLDKLNLPTLIGGVDFYTFRTLRAATPFTGATFRSDAPRIAEWLTALPIVTELEETLGSLQLLSRYKQALFATPQFDQLLRKLQHSAETYTQLFNVQTLAELETVYRSVARCQLVANETFRSYFELWQKPKERRRFEKLRTSYTALTARLALLSGETSVWKQAPAASQAASWLQQLSTKQSWLAGRKLRKVLENALNDASVDPKTALEKWLEYTSVQQQLIELETQFANWGITRPAVELESAAYVLRQLEQEDPNELNRVAQLSATARAAIIENGNGLKQFLQDVSHYLNIPESADLVTMLNETERAPEILLPCLQAIRQLPEAVFRLLPYGKTAMELQDVVLHANERLLEAQFPELAKFDGAWLETKLDAIVATEQEEFTLFAQTLIAQRKTEFAQYARLLRTPAAQLKGEAKAFKAKLKAGKAILVKEFGKSKQHLTIRELLAGDARKWIELLTPVWLSTPAQVGKTFPMEQRLFDWVIFDEASQLPLPNALGALQRSRRAVVAGDEQQMAPTSYFAAGKTAVDLLHQASYYWTKVPLKHHYRSEHPALIAFSNRHFYKDELVAYPSVNTHWPLHTHFVADGVYEARTNIPEAKAVAAFLETVTWQQSVGIVAFSEQQLACIWNACSPEIQEKITVGTEENNVFFKALEQVQGDECDILVVSLGYGKNPEGAFHLRFGPLNQSQGHKRLNVLLTRAKTALHFFTSVRSTDFAISSNESVNLLRLFLARLEQEAQPAELVLPYRLEPSAISGSHMTIPWVYRAIPSAQELVTFHRVMKARGWKINY